MKDEGGKAAWPWLLRLRTGRSGDASPPGGPHLRACDLSPVRCGFLKQGGGRGSCVLSCQGRVSLSQIITLGGHHKPEQRDKTYLNVHSFQHHCLPTEPSHSLLWECALGPYFHGPPHHQGPLVLQGQHQGPPHLEAPCLLLRGATDPSLPRMSPEHCIVVPPSGHSPVSWSLRNLGRNPGTPLPSFSLSLFTCIHKIG